MKKLFLLMTACVLLFAVSTQAQNKVLTAGDSILVRNNSINGSLTFLAVADTAGGSTDTLVVEYYNSYLNKYLTLGVMKMTDRLFTTSIIPGNGLSGLWLVNFPTPTDIRVRRTNVTNRTSRTKVEFVYPVVD